jgi:hypothetical protein
MGHTPLSMPHMPFTDNLRLRRPESVVQCTDVKPLYADLLVTDCIIVCSQCPVTNFQGIHDSHMHVQDSGLAYHILYQ